MVSCGGGGLTVQFVRMGEEKVRPEKQVNKIMKSKSKVLINIFSLLIIIFTFTFSRSKGFVASVSKPENEILYSKDLMSSGNSADFGPLCGYLFIPILFLLLLPFWKNKTRIFLFGIGWVLLCIVFSIMVYVEVPDIWDTIVVDKNYSLLLWLITVACSLPVIIFTYLRFDKKNEIDSFKPTSKTQG
jgi:hypothetical protein